MQSRQQSHPPLNSSLAGEYLLYPIQAFSVVALNPYLWVLYHKVRFFLLLLAR
jgi:hypothetical protein